MLPESTTTKSVMLAKAMGWELRVSHDTDGSPDCILLDHEMIRQNGGMFEYTFYPGDEHVEAVWRKMTPDLYAPENMALALRCLNWARRRLPPQHRQRLKDWLVYRINRDLIFFLDVQDDQEYILDYVLELAIEAGLVEVGNESG